MDKNDLAILMKDAKNDPSNPQLKFELIKATRHFLPRWHLPMLYDEPRNHFYKKMIESKVRGKTVFEIGTGTGFLALLAAEAGAKHVYACEMNPLFQHLSEQTISQSAYASAITVIAKESTKIEVGVDLPEKVDVIISEILSTDVFSENMIAYLRDAKRLLKPQGLFLPSMVEVWACLVESNHRPQETPTTFTMPLENLVQNLPQFHYSRLRLASKPKRIATLKNGFELDGAPPWRVRFERTQATSQTALCISFKLIEEAATLTSFPAQPGDPADLLYAQSWGQMLYPLDQRDVYSLAIHLLDEQNVVVTNQN